MKKWILTIAVLLLVAAPANAGLADYLSNLLGLEAPSRTDATESFEAAIGGAIDPVPQHLAIWLLGTPTELDNPDAEISLRLGWQNDDTEFGAQFDAIGFHGENHETFGMYALLWLTDTEYVGYAGSIMSENISYGPVVGTVLAGVIVEYRYRDFSGESPLGNADDRHQVFAGVRLEF